MLKFDEPQLLDALRRLPNYARVGFAAACAERQVSSYARFNALTKEGDPASITAALDSIWDDLTGKVALEELLKQHLERSMSLIPGSDGGGFAAIRAAAEDAVAAVVYTLRARLTSCSQEAAWAARRAYEAIDHHILSRLNTSVITPDIEQFVVANPLIQAELQRQDLDLSELTKLTRSKADVVPTIVKLRNRAKKDALKFLSLDS
jgi:uncharacterized protein YjaG (DUF416 family)